MLPLPPSQALLILTAALLVGGALEFWLAARLAPGMAGASPRAASWPTLGAPCAQALTTLIAVLAAYPAVYGLRAAVPAAELLRDDPPRGGALLVVLCLVGLLAARVPWLGRRPAAIRALQGYVAVGWLFDWLRDELGALSASAWPTPWAGFALLGLALLLPHLAGALGREFGGLVDQRLATRGMTLPFGAFYERLAVAAVLTLYGFLLGQQLGI